MADWSFYAFMEENDPSLRSFGKNRSNSSWWLKGGEKNEAATDKMQSEKKEGEIFMKRIGSSKNASVRAAFATAAD